MPHLTNLHPFPEATQLAKTGKTEELDPFSFARPNGNNATGAAPDSAGPMAIGAVGNGRRPDDPAALSPEGVRPTMTEDHDFLATDTRSAEGVTADPSPDDIAAASVATDPPEPLQSLFQEWRTGLEQWRCAPRGLTEDEMAARTDRDIARMFRTLSKPAASARDLALKVYLMLAANHDAWFCGVLSEKTWDSQQIGYIGSRAELLVADDLVRFAPELAPLLAGARRVGADAMAALELNGEHVADHELGFGSYETTVPDVVVATGRTLRELHREWADLETKRGELNIEITVREDTGDSDGNLRSLNCELQDVCRRLDELRDAIETFPVTDISKIAALLDLSLAYRAVGADPIDLPKYDFYFCLVMRALRQLAPGIEISWLRRETPEGYSMKRMEALIYDSDPPDTSDEEDTEGDEPDGFNDVPQERPSPSTTKEAPVMVPAAFCRSATAADEQVIAIAARLAAARAAYAELVDQEDALRADRRATREQREIIEERVLAASDEIDEIRSEFGRTTAHTCEGIEVQFQLLGGEIRDLGYGDDDVEVRLWRSAYAGAPAMLRNPIEPGLFEPWDAPPASLRQLRTRVALLALVEDRRSQNEWLYQQLLNRKSFPRERGTVVAICRRIIEALDNLAGTGSAEADDLADLLDKPDDEPFEWKVGGRKASAAETTELSGDEKQFLGNWRRLAEPERAAVTCLLKLPKPDRDAMIDLCARLAVPLRHERNLLAAE